MGWGGITVFWRRDGQGVLEAQQEVYGEVWEDGDPDLFTAVPVPPPAPEQLAARDAARALLLEVERVPLVETRPPEHAAFLDAWTEVILYSTNATVLVAPARTPGTFPVMWRRVVRLAALAPSVVLDTDDLQLIDVSLGTRAAYDAYRWCG